MRVCAEGIGVAANREKSDDAQRNRDPDRHYPGLIEHELGMRLIFSSGRLRNERSCSDAEHLRHREHDHVQVSGHANRRDGFLTETTHPKKIGEKIKRLHQHAHRHERGHVQQMFNDRTLRQILHALSILWSALRC